MVLGALLFCHCAIAMAAWTRTTTKEIFKNIHQSTQQFTLEVITSSESSYQRGCEASLHVKRQIPLGSLPKDEPVTLPLELRTHF